MSLILNVSRLCEYHYVYELIDESEWSKNMNMRRASMSKSVSMNVCKSMSKNLNLNECERVYEQERV